MKCVVLAGGLGTRLAEETNLRPKPMVEIGGKPIIWHIMKIYSTHGINDFIICLGYKGYVIKEYFSNYFLHMSDVTFEINRNQMQVHGRHAEPWRVTLIDTGESSMTGGRLKRVFPYLDDEDFCFTYGDGVSDVNITAIIKSHRDSGVLATVTAARPPGRFGAMHLEGNKIIDFREKPIGDGGWINGGFFVLSPGVIDYISGDDSVWERESMENLAKDGQLAAYKHYGYWRAMDTLRDKNDLEKEWADGSAAWKIWE